MGASPGILGPVRYVPGLPVKAVFFCHPVNIGSGHFETERARSQDCCGVDLRLLLSELRPLRFKPLPQLVPLLQRQHVALPAHCCLLHQGLWLVSSAAAPGHC